MAIGVGDCVSLKCGGPMMTVTELRPREPSVADCVWFIERTLQRDTFAVAELQKWVPARDA